MVCTWADWALMTAARSSGRGPVADLHRLAVVVGQLEGGDIRDRAGLDGDLHLDGAEPGLDDTAGVGPGGLRRGARSGPSRPPPDAGWIAPRRSAGPTRRPMRPPPRSPCRRRARRTASRPGGSRRRPVLLKPLRVFSPVEPFVVELFFADTGRAGFADHTARPGGRAADVHVGVGDVRGVAGQPVPGTDGRFRQPALSAGGPGAGEMEQRGAAAAAEFQDFVAQVQLLPRCGRGGSRWRSPVQRGCSPAGRGWG